MATALFFFKLTFLVVTKYLVKFSGVVSILSHSYMEVKTFEATFSLTAHSTSFRQPALLKKFIVNFTGNMAAFGQQCGNSDYR